MRFIVESGKQVAFFVMGSDSYRLVPCEHDELVEAIQRDAMFELEFDISLTEREQQLKQSVLDAFKNAWASIDLGKILMHPAIMRDKVEAIQRESFRERDRASTSFLRRKLGLEEGDATDALTRYYEHEFRLQRAKDIEDALIADRIDEAACDLRAIGQDALTWAGWMIAARLIPVRQAQ